MPQGGNVPVDSCFHGNARPSHKQVETAALTHLGAQQETDYVS